MTLAENYLTSGVLDKLIHSCKEIFHHHHYYVIAWFLWLIAVCLDVLYLI